MWNCAVLDKYMLLSLLLLNSQVMVQALRDVKVSVPHAVRKGATAVLRCSYDMEGDSLYAVKWYKGRREFYRYTPKENPAMKMFGIGGVHVEPRLSNETQLTLRTVQSSTSGKYSCEVSADAPSFHTLIASGELEVVDVPEGKPAITGIKSRYQIGESLRANCTSRHSKPAANLTWAINDKPANPLHVKHHRALVDARSDHQTSISGIQFVVLPQHFFRGKLKLRCTAHIHDIFWQSTERSIEEERPRVNSVAASSNNVNSISSGPYDQFSLDGDLPHGKDTYMTHMQGDMSSLNAGSAFISSSLILTLFMLQLQQLFISHLSKVSRLISTATNSNTSSPPARTTSSESSQSASGQQHTTMTPTKATTTVQTTETKSTATTRTTQALQRSKSCNSADSSIHKLSNFSRTTTNNTVADSHHLSLRPVEYDNRNNIVPNYKWEHVMMLQQSACS